MRLNLKFSIIIPVHNAQGTLKSCLGSISSSENRDFEVVVVDDKSTDKSVEIAKDYPCRIITLNQNKGTAFSRNTGRDNAKGEILVFIDADVVIKKDTLNIIDASFKKNEDIVAVTGLLSKECPYNDFFTRYKNLYMHYIFRQCPRFVDFLFGSIIAINKDDFLSFNESFRATDDTELGQRYKELNKKILLNQELEVIHLKKYNFKEIIENDFFVPFWWTKSFILHKGYRDIFKKRRFSHARANQLLSILVVYLIVLSLLIVCQQQIWSIRFGLLIIFLILNYGFFRFLYKEKGLLFLIGSVVFTFLDSLIMGLGAITGFFRYLILRRKDKTEK